VSRPRCRLGHPTRLVVDRYSQRLSKGGRVCAFITAVPITKLFAIRPATKPPPHHHLEEGGLFCRLNSPASSRVAAARCPRCRCTGFVGRQRRADHRLLGDHVSPDLICELAPNCGARYLDFRPASNSHPAGAERCKTLLQRCLCGRVPQPRVQPRPPALQV
jgi:hypothetical protein